jgi:hypothetical protein
MVEESPGDGVPRTKQTDASCKADPRRRSDAGNSNLVLIPTDLSLFCVMGGLIADVLNK